MTVTYSAEVATSRGFGCFWKLLFRWRGSIYKLLWPDLFLYLFVYYFLSIIYRFTLSEFQRRYFEKVSIYCKTYGDLIPVSFILGFYVSIVVKRWWDSFNCIPWPDTLAFFVSAYIHGQDERGRLMRRSIMRYANLALVITLSCISPCVKKRFPTMDHLVEAGMIGSWLQFGSDCDTPGCELNCSVLKDFLETLSRRHCYKTIIVYTKDLACCLCISGYKCILLPNEKKIMEQLKTSHSTYWMPLVWASSIAIRARKEGRIRDDFALNTLIDAIAHYRSLCGGLFNYDWVSIPLVYTQVVTLVVYTFFLATLMGRQYLDPAQKHPGYEVDLYIPIFNFLQFFFYMGWLKVAETLVNPFGEDDDDFEVNWVIDRDIQVSYLIVDEMHQEHPELIKDQYWDEVLPDLPYTAASMPFYTQPPLGSAANLVISAQEAEFIPLEPLEEDDEELENVKVNGIPFTANHPRSFLASNLSGSSCSGLSRLGRSFHPRSYERKGILNLMHDFLKKESSNKDIISRDSSVRKNLYKTQSKDSTGNPSLCDTSGPPTPEEYGDRMQRFNDDMFFQDDIFRLSDLSLADSRGTGAVQSPGIFSNAQLSDFFSRMKPERPHRISLTKQGSTPKAMSPKSDVPDDESIGTPSTGKKKRTNSLRNFFKPSKYKGSQKSLFDSIRRDYTASQMISPSEYAEDSEKCEDEKFETNVDEDPSMNNSDEEVTVKEAHPIPQNMSKSTVDIGHKSSMSGPIPFERPRKSLPHMFSNSPENLNPGKLIKEPSTSTLVSGEGSLENTPPSAVEKKSPLKVGILQDTRIAPDDTDVSSIENSPTKTSEMSLLQRRLHSKLKPSRTISLQLNEKKDVEARGLTGMQKFRRKHRGFFRAFSQPVSPTEIESPVGFPPPRAGFFKRQHSKGSDVTAAKSSSRGSLLGRRHSRDVELSSVASAAQGFLSRRSSKEGERPSATVGNHAGDLLCRKHSKEVQLPYAAISSQGELQNKGHNKATAAVSPPGGVLNLRHSKEGESPSATTFSQEDLLSKGYSKDGNSPITSAADGVLNRCLSKDIDSPRGSTSSLKSLFNRRMSKDGKTLSPLQIQANPQIIISPNFVDEKNQKNKEISDV